MTMASASTVGRRSPARSWTLRSQRTHSGAGGRRDVLCSPTWIWGCWTQKAHGAVQDLGHCCSPGLLFPLPGCLWVQEGSALSFASRKGGGELAQVPLSAAKGDRAPWWLWPSFHPHMELSSCISETRVCNQRCCDYPASISGGLKGGGFLHEKKNSSLWIPSAVRSYLAAYTETAHPALLPFWECALPETVTDLPEHTGSILLKKESRSCEQS